MPTAKAILKKLQPENIIRAVDKPIEDAFFLFIKSLKASNVKNEKEGLKIITECHTILHTAFYGVKVSLDFDLATGAAKEFIDRHVRGGYQESMRNILNGKNGGLIAVLTKMSQEMKEVGRKQYINGIHLMLPQLEYSVLEQFVKDYLTIYGKFLPTNFVHEPIPILVMKLKELLNLHLLLMKQIADVL